MRAFILIGLVGAFLVVSRHLFGRTSQPYEAPLSAGMNLLFKSADVDGSGSVDFNEWFFWHRRTNIKMQNALDSAPVVPGAIASTSTTPEVAPRPAISNANFDNKFIRVQGEPAAKSAAAFAPPPPSPPPSPAPTARQPHTYDNQMMRTTDATAGADETEKPPGPTYEADASCNPTLHAGYGGGAFTWGMEFKVESAAACCAACKAHARTCGGADNIGKTFVTRSFKGKAKDEKCSKSMGSNEGDQAIVGKCNTWVFCPTVRRSPHVGGPCASGVSRLFA